MTTTTDVNVAHLTEAPFVPAKKSLAGMPVMIALVLSRNWVRLIVWVVAVAGMFGFVGAYYSALLTTQKALDDFAAIGDTPSIRALTGVAEVPNTLGGATWTKIWMTCAIALVLGVIFLVTRNGRADEEAGRAELLRSRMLGVHASSLASYLVATTLCLVTGIATTAISAAVGLDPAGSGITGSLVLGASVAGIAFAFLGVAAVAGQLASTGRGANTLASIVVAVFYVIRMSGDMNGSWLTWASPIGWAEKMSPYGADRWWLLFPLIGIGVTLCLVALALEGRRDHGTGLLPDRAGPADAPAWYSTTVGLGIRLQRSSVIGWTIALVLAALLFGSVIDAMTDLIDDSGSQFAQIVGGSGLDPLLAMLVMLLGMVTAAFALQTTMQLRSEESGGTLEPQLVRALGRTRWAIGRLAIPIVGSAILLALSGMFMGMSYGASIGDSAKAGELAGAALAYWPAVMVLVAIGVTLFGWLPRFATSVTWGLLAVTWALGMFGDVLGLPDWVMNAMPFSATPYLPYESMDWAPLLVMSAISVALLVFGLLGFKRRDVQGG